MNKYYGSAFAVLISFIFLLSISLFLYSCGQNNPSGTGVQTASTTQPAINIASTAMSVQSTLTSITITIDPNIKKKYQLYYVENTSNASSGKPVLLSPVQGTTYQVSVSSDKSYAFVLIEISDNNIPIGTIAIIMSGLSEDKTSRVNLYMDKNGGMPLNMPKEVTEPASPAISPLSPPSAASATISAIFSLMPQALAYTGITYAPYPPASAKLCGWHYIGGDKWTQTITGIAPNGWPIPGSDITIVQTTTYTWYVNGTCTGKTEPQESWPVTITEIFKPGIGTYYLADWSQVGIPKNYQFYTPCEIKLTKIDITPTNKTVKPGDSIPYTAMGTMVCSDNTKYTARIMPGWWKSSKPKVAGFYGWWNDGIATALSNGETTITAESPTLKGEIIKSNEATLKVTGNKCHNQSPTYYKQIDPKWKDELLGNHTTPGDSSAVSGVNVTTHSLGWVGCQVSTMAMVLSTAGINIDPKDLNNKMKTDKHFDGENGLPWEVIPSYSNGKILGVKDITSDDIQKELDNCNLVVAQLPTKYHGCAHWVMINGYSSDGSLTGYNPIRGDGIWKDTDFCSGFIVIELAK